MKLSKQNLQQKPPLNSSDFDYNSLENLNEKAQRTRQIVHAHLNFLTLNFAKNKHIGVAVSGGSDSLCLLILACDWAKLHGWKVSACTVDHRLRPAATLEASYVHQLCCGLGIEHDILTVEWPKGSTTKPTQTTARNARHLLFANWTRTKNITALLVGHTLDDRIETMLMRETSGSTDYGLAAMPGKSASPIWPEGRHLSILRPANSASREALCDILENIGVRWVLDPSNDNLDYERVRIRSHIASLSKNERADLIHRLQDLSNKRAQTNKLVTAFLRDHTVWHQDGRTSFKMPAFAALTNDLKHRAVERILLCVSGAQRPVNISRIEKLIQNIDTNKLTAKPVTECLGNCMIHMSKTNMQFSLLPPKDKTASKDMPPPPLHVSKDQEAIFMGRFLISLKTDTPDVYVETWENAFKHDIKHGPYPDRECENLFANRTYPVLMKSTASGSKQQLSSDQFSISCLHEQRKNHLSNEDFVPIAPLLY